MDRAYSTFLIKSVDAEQRLIEGFASTPELDRQGDSMDPEGAKFTLPLSLLWQHKSDKPIGKVLSARVTSAGIFVKAQIAQGVLPFIEEAWALIKAGLVGGFSIDWKPLAAPVMKNGAIRYAKWEMLALSVVTVPANTSATIRLIKSIDSAALAASGIAPSVPLSPGVTGLPKVTSMNVSEQLTAERNALQTKSARLNEIISNEQANGSLDAEETKELETLTPEIDTLSAKISRLTTLEKAQASMAGAVVSMPAAASKAVTTPGTGVYVPPREKGQVFTRYAMAIAAGKGSRMDTLDYAKRFGPEVVAYIKATEGVALLNSPSWGSELVNPNTAATEFVQLLNPATIIGRVSGFRNVLFNIPIITQTGASTFEWVDEGAEKPVGELAFDRTTLTNSKVSGIIVLSDELVRLSDPKAEAIVRQDLVEQCAKFLDEQFIHVGVTAGTSSPASITNGVPSPSATGATATALLHDLNIALATFDNNAEGLVIVTTPAIARGISLLLTTLGNRQFPEMTPTGGSLLGYPVIVSSSVESGVVVIFKPSDILLADDGRVTLDASNQATLNMNSGASPGTATFSLWQRNCTAIRAERWIKWQKRRANVVAIIDTAAYAPA